MKLNNDKSLFDSRAFRIGFSIAVAVICWIVVAFTISDTGTSTIREVPVTIQASNATYQSLGLDIIDNTSSITVNVKVEGPRSVVGLLNKNSIRVTPSFSGVREAGTYDLPLTVSKTNQLEDFDVVSVEPEFITLRFDNAVSQKVAVTANVIGLETTGDYVVQNPVITPAEINITGPEQDVEKVAKAVVEVTVNDQVTETVRRSGEIVLYDEEGEVVNLPTLKVDSTEAEVTVPVYKRGVLPIKIEFTNVPEGFDIASLHYSMSVTELNVAASAGTIDNLKPRTVGYVDLSAFEIGESYLFDINLPAGMVNIDNIKQVTVVFPKENIASKRVNVTDIRVQNVPADMNVTVQSTRISNVTVIGPTEDVENLTAGSVIAIVDMEEQIVEQGSYNVPVKFVVTSNSTTFVSGVYNVLIDVEPS